MSETRAGVRAKTLARSGLAPRGRVEGRRYVAMGDPQCSADRLFKVLDRHGLLGDDGFLRPEVGLVSMGDHFDYGGSEGHGPREAGEHGAAILRWLAAHDDDQVVILLGNHDVSRVSELHDVSDEEFARARELSQAIERAGTEADELEAEFVRRHPSIPTPEVARRDYSAFDEGQRALVQELLLRGRVRLSVAATLPSGREALLTHAGVTRRELAMLGKGDGAGAVELSEALEERLREGVARARVRWERGEPARLELGGLHVPGGRGKEGGGMLYHRPAEREADPWGFDEEAPRRFEPGALPRGLVQVVGHSGHRKCSERLSRWATERAKGAGHASLRTLAVGEGGARYDVGVHEPREGEATMYLIDPEMSRAPDDDIELLPLGNMLTRR